MFNIRNCLFETNSSSTHSIGIQKNNQALSIPTKLTIAPGEYGWNHDVLSSPEELGSYLYTAILNLYDDPKQRSEWKTYLYDVCYANGCELEFVEPTINSFGFYDYYIDHVDELEEWLHKLRHNSKRLLRFLFGEHSFIITSNDNDGHEYIEEMEKLLVNKDIETYFKGN